MKVETHFFTVKLAEQVGLRGAIIIGNLAYLQLQHQTSERQEFLHDGRYWVKHTYQSLADWHSYLTVEQIRYTMKKLVDSGHLHHSQFGGRAWDRDSYWHVDLILCQLGKFPDDKWENPHMTTGKIPRCSTDKQQQTNTRKIKFSDEHYAAAKEMADTLRLKKQPNLNNWADTFRLMEEIDQIPPSEALRVFHLANQDEFWSSNVLSPGKLRDQFDQVDRKLSPRVKTNPAKKRTTYQDSV